ncbi:hypothetical protein SAMN05216371_8311 [Streptomyces sp. TLI_053]|uniref:hypothetical protein n=1 Tax=Streptomyces sp. TLI_053 TaxID=1855352 RepID=UPI00087A1973|nr:hypothetical protein [Streptomyces sp. TLI_053]SDT83477.1 hypothetical protein SAMN05216371_8311 [Streptomyces sp. TLI_053]
MDVHIPLDPAIFGHAWVLSGWTVQPDVLVILAEGYPVGWVERGLDGGDGWVAVYEDHFLGDPEIQRAALPRHPGTGRPECPPGPRPQPLTVMM